MADCEKEVWFVGEDGCLSVGDAVQSVTYHPTLNALLVCTKEPRIRVIDVTSGAHLQSSDLSAGSDSTPIQCLHMPSRDKTVFCGCHAVSCRKDSSGVLLLDTALQTAVKQAEDQVCVELMLPDANHLFKCLMSAELAGVDYVEDVLRELETEIEAVQNATKYNHKVAKWATVKIKLPHFALKTVCSTLMTELRRLHQNVPGLSVAAAINDRLNYLLPSSTTDTLGGQVDRSLMYSEAARWDTFAKWPHMNYKWALPDPMAQAGFYHQPSSTGDDRAMCFTCNVCLICWEPTDEPWSEHERHSPQCPFVKGEYTQNVPMSATFATEPAQPHGSETDQIVCLSSSSSDEYFATSTLQGNVVIWSINRQMEKHIQFNIDPWEPVVTSRTGSQTCVYSDTKAKPSILGCTSSNPLADSLAEPISEPSTSQEKSSNETDCKKSVVLCDSKSVQTRVESGTLEVIEVSGAWKKEPVPPVVEVSLHNNQCVEEPFQRCRPSQDVQVSALCMLGSPNAAVAAATEDASCSTARPCLVSGVGIRRNVLSINDIVITSMGSSGCSSLEEEGSEVQALNQVNQAKSNEDVPEIISEGVTEKKVELSGNGNPFVPFLLIHDIKSTKSGCIGSNDLKEKISKPKKSSSSGTGGGSKQENQMGLSNMISKSLAQELQDHFIDLDDSDVQIVGVEGEEEPLVLSKVALPSASVGLSESGNSIVQSQSVSSEQSQLMCTQEGVIGPLAKYTTMKEGCIVQCIALPKPVDHTHHIKSMFPTPDGKHLVVITAPNQNEDLDADTMSHDNIDITSTPVKDSGCDAAADVDTSVCDAPSAEPCPPGVGGCVVVYRVCEDQGMVCLDCAPCRVHVLDQLGDAIVSALMLPLEVNHTEEDGAASNSDGTSPWSQPDVEGCLVIVTRAGHAQVLKLNDFRLLADIGPPEADPFISAAYCTGIDRLCCCTTEGKLHFYMLGPRNSLLDDGTLEDVTDGTSLNKVPSVTGEDAMDTTLGDQPTKSDLLAMQPLDLEVLTALYELTQFENLVPRFSATLPPCWNEIQQEQQQRRHPQHLQHHGEATQHTRTWKLQPDSSSWDEHMFELVLPKPSSLGHIDIKFSLHPLCTTAPSIQITLLKQIGSTLGRAGTTMAPVPPAQVDDKIEFNMTLGNANDVIDLGCISEVLSSSQSDEAKSATVSSSSSSATLTAGSAAAAAADKMHVKVVNPVTSQLFLEHHKAEIVCGPVDLAQYVDLSGHNGVVTLSSPQLLKVRSRALLLHVKAMVAPNKQTQDKAKQQEKSSSVHRPSTSSKEKKPSLCKLAADQFPYMPGTADKHAGGRKIESLWGCDLLQEISVTVRKCRRTSIPRDRVQRNAMVELLSFHEQLMVTACGSQASSTPSESLEHQQKLALDILTWIAALQINSVGKNDTSMVALTVQSNLPALVRACLLDAPRAVAHQCARLLSFFTMHTKVISSVVPSPSFSVSLLHALLDCLPHIPSATSAGALHWYFTLLNRVKCMDANLTSQKCAEMLSAAAAEYDERQNPLHALLQTRFGLYGRPLEPELFDVEPPYLAQRVADMGTSSENSYAGIVGASAATAGATAATPLFPEESLDLSDFVHIAMLDRGAASGVPSSSSLSKGGSEQAAHHSFGLLEVEPLHFACHATSDGTRLERIDAGQPHSTTNGPSGLSGTINFTEPGQGALSSAAGVALASLSNAMASAEQQLQQLQQKQIQLLKLQQQKQKLEMKLAETSTKGGGPFNHSGSAGSAYSAYNSELFPPTPKNTPFFMTPPVTPPNESYHNIFIGPGDPSKPPTGKESKAGGKADGSSQKLALYWPQSHNLFQPPPPQALVIERMHSGARRFVVLDFGAPILLTDVLVPASSDLASLSIDIWVSGEDVDGQRLVVSPDIGTRSLIMNNLMPPPLCRYLKITTIGRYGASTTRSKIPLGSFYGHTFILPWEAQIAQQALCPSEGTHSQKSEPTLYPQAEQSQLLSQVSVYLSLLEDIQCRYSLACNRLTSLLAAIDAPHNPIAHTQYFLRKSRKAEEDAKTLQAYHDCMSLQLQLNLAHRAIQRLQRALGIRSLHSPSGMGRTPGSGPTPMALLKDACTDKLRYLTEQLLATLLGMTNPSPSIPQVPITFHMTFDPQMCESLFRNICIMGTRKMQIQTGVLLVRVCGSQDWWGDFLGNLIQEFFSSDHSSVFPRDRVFLVLTALGQRALHGPNASRVLESMLSLLARLLLPLLSTHHHHHGVASIMMLDMSMISWLLLFLSKCLDCATTNWAEDNDKASKDKENGSMPNRWDFLHGETALQSRKQSSRSLASRLYRKRLQKRLMHHKQQLLSIQQSKKSYLSAGQAAAEKMWTGSKGGFQDMMALIEGSEMDFKKQFKQYSSKHFKDIMNIRKTDGELLRKLSKEGASSSGGGADRDGGTESDLDSVVTVTRERCIPVIRGLVSLLLSMDFTCNADLFIVTCKVLARIAGLARPSIQLSEVMSPEELEQVLLLMCSAEYNHGNISWGTVWASHTITCLLQDILDGEKLGGTTAEGSVDEDISASCVTETDDSLPNSGTLPTMDESVQDSTTLPTVDEDCMTSDETDVAASAAKDSNANTGYKLDKEGSLILDMLLEEDDDIPAMSSLDNINYMTLDNAGGAADVPSTSLVGVPVSGGVGTGTKNYSAMFGLSNSMGKYAPVSSALSNLTSMSNGLGLEAVKWTMPGPTWQGGPGAGGSTLHQSKISDILEAGGLSLMTSSSAVLPGGGTNNDKSSKHMKWWKDKLATYFVQRSPSAPQGISTAIDSRLENSLELTAELKLKVMLTMEMETIQNALTAVLPPLPPMLPGCPIHSLSTSHSLTDEEQLSGNSFFIANQGMNSVEMLSGCFTRLFQQLPQHTINLDSLLAAWLTLNDEPGCNEDAMQPVFDSSRVPSIPLNPAAVTTLLATLAWSPHMPVRTWVLALQTLTLLANLKVPTQETASHNDGGEQWLAAVIVADPNLMNVFVKFLSGTNSNGSVATNQNAMQIGPTATKVFHEFLVRLQVKCAESSENHLKELLLKLVYTLTSDRGAFSLGLGPLDVQCKLLDLMLEQSYESVDISNALSVVQAVSCLVHQHLFSQERTACRSSTESTVSARSCFGGILASVLRSEVAKSTSNQTSRDMLMGSLLKLVGLLVQIPLPGHHRSAQPPHPPTATPGASVSVLGGAETHTADNLDSPMTDLSKMSLGQTGHIVTSTPNIPLETSQSDEEKGSQLKPTVLLRAMTGQEQHASSTVDSSLLEPERRDAALCDVVLRHQHVMSNLLQALSCCNSSTMAMLISSSGLNAKLQDSFNNTDPVSVGDGVFHLMWILNKCTTDLTLVMRPVYEYLVGRGGLGGSGLSRLSEPLLWFILRVLSNTQAINIFLEMGGIQAVCENLVRTNRQVINTSPSLVSTIMQYLASSRTSSSSSKKGSSSSSENADGLQNFAPLGAISSSSPTACPAEVLIQAAPPHRRARSAAWSYHFYPDEVWVDLTIALPCAVLLREVQIQPHLASLATCPSAVTLEVSRDGSTMTPICSPVSTSGLTCIKITLLRPEVVSVVTLRLHKPRDSSTIGLSQLMLMGTTVFSDVAAFKASSITAPMEDYVSLTSIGWLRLLHHCLTVSSEAQEAVARAAAPTPDLLLTCTSLLGSSSAVLYANSIEAVMLKVGLHSQQMGLSLLHLLLRNSLLATDNNVRLHNRRGCYANESTVDILYQLGIHQDEDTCSRLRVLIEWLGDSAQIALDRSRSQKPMSSAHRAGHSGQHQLVVDATCPAQAHVHCVAAVLWFSHDSTVHYDLKQIVTQDLLSLMYEWSMVLPAESILKQSVDAVVCAMCYIQPQYFSLLLQWMGVHLPPTDLSSASVSDDHKETGVSVNSVAASLTQEMLTDDLKADEARNRLEATLSIPQAMGLATPHLSNSDPYMVLPQLLTEEQLTTLAVASQSPVALAQMLDSGLLGQLCQGLFEFCMNQLSHLGEFHHLINTDGMTDNGKANSDPTSPRPPYSPGGTSSRSHSTSGPQGHDCSASVDLVAPTLRFLAEVAQEVEVKVWLGGDQASVFWPVLLRLLCATPRQLVSPDLVHAGSTKTMTSHHRSLIETATIDFFSSIISCHPENQLQFATVLCDVIGGKGSENGLSSCPLSGFMRRLFLQVLLEDEKVLVCFKSPSQLYKGPSNALSSSIQHPRFGAGHKYRTIWASLQSSCGDVLSRVSDTANTLSQLSTVEKEKKGEAEWPKDVSELGIEVVDQLSAAAGLQAKEKRAKSKAPFSPRHPPRPPSRRGHRPPDKIAGGIIPVLSIYHKMLPDQPIPHGISLSQLLVLLRQRGFPVGQGWLELNMTLEPKSTPCEKAESRPKPESEIGGQEATTSDGPEPSVERIPDEVLLDTSTMPSALQVFASVGGLALLAEHLPLLYPEITRQAVPTEASKETNTGATSTGQDWVTVESIEDMYEEAYEAIPATHPPVGTKPALAPLPTIPPHSLVSFGLFLRLPGYAEVLLQEKKKAQCLLRLVLGVTDDGDGGHILLSPTAGALPTLPFHVLELLFDATPLSTDDGVLLRRMTLDIGAVHLVLACLSVLSHHAPRQPIPGFHQEIILAATHASSTVSSTAASASTTTGAASTANPSTSAAPKSMADDKGQLYWAKGTGFGTGSTASSWDAEQALLRQKSEEEHVTCLLQVLATYIHPGGCIPPEEDLAERSEEEGSNSNLPSSLQDLLSQSCLVPSISSYLRNDSVLDMARHVPLYRALLKLLRGLAVCQTLVPLLLPLEKDEDSTVSISSLLDKMKSCVDTYASRLKTNKKGKNRQEDEESEGLALLIPDIQETARIVEKSIHCVRHKSVENGDDSVEMEEVPQAAVRLDRSLSYTYMSCMRALQFDTYEMVVEEDGKLEFTVPHHYEGNVRSAGDINNAARARRLAQEAVTLSTSLPLSYSSSVFVRCDEERLDVMKVLITGPEETPYANGCFEFDVYFPADYPNSPPLINLETTGNHTVRFNPNLYNDGKVCLSILNTWHGRPEEKWNAQTSSFLQVLVSIQSLILVNEPYFNEPGYERSHGTPSGTASSREYDANIRQASVKWGMLEVLRNTPACFRDAVDRHFWMKKEEIMHQIEAWVIDMEMNSSDKRVGRTISHSCVALKRHYAQLKEEFAKMKAPSDLSDEIPESNDPELGSSYSTAAPSRPPPESPLDPAALPLGSDLANHMAASTESEETDTATTTDSNQDTSMHDPDPDEYIL